MSPTSYRFRCLLLIVAGIPVAAGTVYLLLKRADKVDKVPLEHVAIEDRRAELRKRNAEQEASTSRSLERYRPRSKAKYDDLKVPFADFIWEIPGVTAVDTMKAEAIEGRIIHIKDLLLLPRDIVSLFATQAHGRTLTREEVDLLLEQHVLQIELLQIDQMAILRCLIRHHGLKKVFVEGISSRDTSSYGQRLKTLKSMETEQIPNLRRELDEIRKKQEKPGGEDQEKHRKTETEIIARLYEHKRNMLRAGAAGRLLISGELEAVLAMEERNDLETTPPIATAGRAPVDPAKTMERNDGQVRTILRETPYAVIVLDGSQDLSRSIKRITTGTFEYVRVASRGYREVATDPR